jgi:hypothetical protein
MKLLFILIAIGIVIANNPYQNPMVRQHSLFTDNNDANRLSASILGVPEKIT